MPNLTQALRRAARRLLWWLAALAVGVSGSLAATPATGLIPATPEQLRGIPPASTPFSGEELPATVDLSSGFPLPQNQGNQNSCVGWALAYAVKTYQEQVEERQPFVRGDGQLDGNRVFSPAYIYNQVNNGRDGGCSFIDALNLLHQSGAAPWSTMPYDVNDYRRQPDAAANQAARRYRIDIWRQVNAQDNRELKAQLNGGYPVIFGALLDDGFCNAGPGYVWQQTRGESRGFHAMVLVGYDDRRGAFKLINSWGTQWGDDGFGWIAYSHFGRVCSEAYVAKDARNGLPPTPPPEHTPTENPDPVPPVVVPAPNWNAYDAIGFGLTNVTHNAVIPSRPQDGYFLRFDGQLAIPGGLGTSDQVVVCFWFDAGNGTKGQMVGSYHQSYATIYGQAACGTALYPVPPQGLNTTWAAWIPYSMLNVPTGGYVAGPGGWVYQPRSTALVAEAVLYLDNFGVRTSPIIRFLVNR